LDVPNNLLLKITRDYASQILWYKEVVSEKTLMEIYEYLSADFYGLHEFFPQDKKEELIKTFLQQHC
jgi:cupin superfamily acireductone dioxygenase involved in methionine salvage